MSRWSIFGCGPGGLYSAWRLAQSGTLKKGDTLTLYDWGNYRFDGTTSGTRSAAGRICTYYYQDNPDNAYVEVGGMRYIRWNGSPDGGGHRLVTTVIHEMGLDKEAEPFNTTNDPLFFLRNKHFYASDISAANPAPYDAAHGIAAASPDEAINFLAKQALDGHRPTTRGEQCSFYKDGALPSTYRSSVFNAGAPLRDIGYWNLMLDQLGGEGYRYAAAGGGYQSNVINWNSADALIYNSEFAPGGEFKTLRTGYSSIFPALFEQIGRLCKEAGVALNYCPQTRLRSIWLDKGNHHRITFTTATADAPGECAATETTDVAFLAMPPGALDIVAEGTRYAEGDIVDLLNAPRVALFRDAVIEQPSYKVAMFFDSAWWQTAAYPPKLDGAEANGDETNVFGPTITDLPIRQVYYFGNNARVEEPPVYAVLASYDDERFVRFWQEMELGVGELRQVPLSQDTQPLVGPRKAPQAMVNMLRAQLALVHFGPDAVAADVPVPLETVFMDWSLKPFSAGYHAWAAHYDIDQVMQGIRKPTQLIDGVDANLFIVGSAFSNDQAWVEGAFCTAESVLTDFLGLDPIISPKHYPFICGCGPSASCT